MPNNAQDAIELARNVVIAQGSMFVRELLRRAKLNNPQVRIGVTKPEVLENLIHAIELDALSYDDLDQWVNRTEGWGKQHVYLHRLKRDAATGSLWRSNAAVRAALARHTIVPEATGDDMFPDELVLAQTYATTQRIELIWRRGAEQWRRTPAHDPPEKVIDGDLYRFDAYRRLPYRSIVRAVVLPKLFTAAVFVQSPLSDDEHARSREIATGALHRLLGADNLPRVSISKAIKSLDTQAGQANAASAHGGFQSQHTKFEANGASVTFDADSTIVSWRNIDPVRHVRNALDMSKFRGSIAKFAVTLQSGIGMQRNVIVRLNGPGKRVYLQAQLNEDEAWLILNQIKRQS